MCHSEESTLGRTQPAPRKPSNFSAIDEPAWTQASISVLAEGSTCRVTETVTAVDMGSIVGRKVMVMAIVKINAISVPPQAGPELERRFSERAGAIDGSPGFLGFQLLRPTAGDDRYFVVTHWEDEDSYAAWRDGDSRAAHAGQHGKPVASGAQLLEFDVVMDVRPRS